MQALQAGFHQLLRCGLCGGQTLQPQAVRAEVKPAAWPLEWHASIAERREHAPPPSSIVKIGGSSKSSSGASKWSSSPSLSASSALRRRPPAAAADDAPREVSSSFSACEESSGRLTLAGHTSGGRCRRTCRMNQVQKKQEGVLATLTQQAAPKKTSLSRLSLFKGPVLEDESREFRERRGERSCEETILLQGGKVFQRFSFPLKQQASSVLRERSRALQSPVPSVQPLKNAGASTSSKLNIFGRLTRRDQRVSRSSTRLSSPSEACRASLLRFNPRPHSFLLRRDSLVRSYGERASPSLLGLSDV